MYLGYKGKEVFKEQFFILSWKGVLLRVREIREERKQTPREAETSNMISLYSDWPGSMSLADETKLPIQSTLLNYLSFHPIWGLHSAFKPPQHYLIQAGHH
jgi:hypothetical protein